MALSAVRRAAGSFLRHPERGVSPGPGAYYVKPNVCCEVPTKSPFTDVFAGRVLRVSAVARRAAAAYGDANML